MIHKQGAEYKDSSEIEQAVQEDEAARKKFSPVLIVLGVVAAFVVVLAAVYFCKQVVKQESVLLYEYLKTTDKPKEYHDTFRLYLSYKTKEKENKTVYYEKKI